MSNEKAPTKRKRRSIRRSVLFGGAVGGAGAVILLLAFTVIVLVRMPLDEANSPALGVATYLGGFVCFSVPFIIICTAVGAVGGFVRSRW